MVVPMCNSGELKSSALVICATINSAMILAGPLVSAMSPGSWVFSAMIVPGPILSTMPDVEIG